MDQRIQGTTPSATQAKTVGNDDNRTAPSSICKRSQFSWIKTQHAGYLEASSGAIMSRGATWPVPGEIEINNLAAFRIQNKVTVLPHLAVVSEPCGQ